MDVFEKIFLKLIYLTAACLVATEGRISISEDVKVYAGQSLTLSCRPRGSPPNFVYWYKYARRNDTVGHVRLHTGPSYTISMVTSKDSALYYCSGTEWGIWGISHHIMVNVIEPGKPSCNDGWSLHKHSCYLYYDKQLDTDWHRAAAYCRNVSGATLVKILDSSDANFTRDLTKNRKEFIFWLGLSPDQNGTLHWSDGSPVRHGWGARIHGNENKLLDGMHNCAAFRQHDGTLKTLTFRCAKTLPFICQRDLPRPPSGVRVERITASTARLVWKSPPNSNHGEKETYFTECTTLSGMVVSRKSSVGSFSLLSNLRPNTEYKVRVQAGNSAGNGSSSSYVVFTTKDKPPIIVTSAPNGVVIEGHTVTLQCGDTSQKIAWYKDNNYDQPISRDNVVNIVNSTARDEGTYHCTVNNSMRGSRNITVIEPPRITRLTAILLKDGVREDNSIETWLVCQTANKHPLEYSWSKDGAQLIDRGRKLQVLLKGEETFGKYECQVRNLAGTASRSIVISPLTTTETKSNSSISIELLIVIGALSMVVLFCLVYTAQRNIAARRKNQNRNRKFTAPDSSTEIEAMELDVAGPRESREVESPSGDFNRDNDDVFPYDVIQAWQETGQTGQAGQMYMSLLRRDNRPEAQVVVAQAWKPDYTNISPSNRNDSAANCMYAPLKLTVGSQFAFNPKSRSYENTKASTSSKK